MKQTKIDAKNQSSILKGNSPSKSKIALNKKQKPYIERGKTPNEVDKSKDITKDSKRNIYSSHSIPRNINEYRHLISGFDGGFNITENDIDWVLRLRSPDLELAERSKKVAEHVYSFYGKNIESMKSKKNCIDLSFKGNSQNIDHLFRGRIGPTPGLSVVNFETSLRCNNNQQYLQKEKQWSTIPKKDRNEYPVFLPNLKDEIKMKQTLKDSGDFTKIKMNSAFDPANNFPKYQEKFRYKNLNNLTHLLKPGNTLPMVQWQLSLR